MKTSLWLDSILLFTLACALIWPLFKLEYLANPSSIESTFIADARMLAGNLPHAGWQPLWYCGTRFDYVYTPALRYATALLSRFAGISTARAYHVYVGILYAFGIVAVYWLVRTGSGTRFTAIASALATATLSPCAPLLMHSHLVSNIFPQRLNVLTWSGEGPHIAALSIVPAALAVSFAASRKGNSALLAIASVACAAAVAHNFYGAIALAILFPLVIWSVWLEKSDRRVWFRAAAIALLAYGLCAVWLTPSYLRITLTNLKWLPRPSESSGKLLAALVAVIFVAVTYRLSAWRAIRAWTIFVTGSAIVFGWLVLGYFFLGLRAVGDPERLIPELELALVLASMEVLRRLWKSSLWIAAATLTLICAYPAARYLKYAWSPFPHTGPIQSEYEYRIADWVHKNLPNQRVLPTGSIRFWYDAWFDNPQVDGGSQQGMMNQALPDAIWQIQKGDDPRLSMLWLQALGVNAIIVPDNNSPEKYHDFVKPEKFHGAFPVLYNDGRGTTVYSVPRVHPASARLVDSANISGAAVIRAGNDSDNLSRYVSLVEDPARAPVSVVWRSFDAFDVRANVSAAEAIVIQETYDPAWHAYQMGRSIPIRRDKVMNFMILDAPQGTADIQLRFETPLENRIGLAVTLFSCFLLLSLGTRGIYQWKLLTTK